VDDMPWLFRVEVKQHFKARDFVADLSPGPGEAFRHLVLTGPNGSGKTTILEELGAQLQRWRTAAHGTPFKHVGRTPAPSFLVEITWSDPLEDRYARDDLLVPPASLMDAVLVALSATRHLELEPVKGAKVLDLGEYAPWAPTFKPDAARLFKQHLVNQHVQARLAQPDEPEAAGRIFAWLTRLESGVADLFGLPGLKMEFVRQKYDIEFVEPSGLRYGFDKLPSGFASVLHILAELALRIDAESEDRSGVVVIDEIDAFLHPALQERILPFLTALYPRLQFVVSTHSPAVATSLRNAVVVALGTGRCYDAAELSGTPYGELLTTLFGLETDVDLQTTRELHELRRLWRNPARTPAEQARLAELADALQKTGHALALEVWIDLHADPEPESEATA
jgi:hypothetical protein